MNKKALVTGATGFTGGYLCEGLIERGYKVRALSLPNQDMSKLEKLGVEVVIGDLTKKETLAPAVKDIDVVYHIAAIFREQDVPNSLFYDVNVGGTRKAVIAAHTVPGQSLVHERDGHPPVFLPLMRVQVV